MNEVSENIQLLLDDILLFHEELERVFAMEKGIIKPFIAYFYPVRYNVSNRAAQGRFCDMGAKPGFSLGFFICLKQ